MSDKKLVIRLSCGLTIIALLSGCVSGPIKYAESHVLVRSPPQAINSSGRKVCIYTSNKDDSLTVTRPPNHVALMSHPEIPMGDIIKNTAKRVYRDEHGVTLSHVGNLDAKCSFKIHLRAVDFAYGFKRPNGGPIMDSPNVSITMEVVLLDVDNEVVMSKHYSRAERVYRTFLDAGAVISEVVHVAIYNITNNSIADINSGIKQ